MARSWSDSGAYLGTLSLFLSLLGPKEDIQLTNFSSKSSSVTPPYCLRSSSTASASLISLSAAIARCRSGLERKFCPTDAN